MNVAEFDPDIIERLVENGERLAEGWTLRESYVSTYVDQDRDTDIVSTYMSHILVYEGQQYRVTTVCDSWDGPNIHKIVPVEDYVVAERRWLTTEERAALNDRSVLPEEEFTWLN